MNSRSTSELTFPNVKNDTEHNTVQSMFFFIWVKTSPADRASNSAATDLTPMRLGSKGGFDARRSWQSLRPHFDEAPLKPLGHFDPSPPTSPPPRLGRPHGKWDQEGEEPQIRASFPLPPQFRSFSGCLDEKKKPETPLACIECATSCEVCES